MVFHQQLVAVIKHNGRILREDKGTVLLPFGAEYSILLKNLNAYKAAVTISIDGQDVLDNRQIIVYPNSETEIERFLDDLNKGNKFRFIQKTQKIQEHRGDRVDDGIVRIEYQFEEPVRIAPVWAKSTLGYPSTNGTWYCDNLNGTQVSNTAATYNVRGITSSAPQVDEGITVKGSESTQQFQEAYIGRLNPEKHVVTLALKGETITGNPIAEAITVKTKKVCKTCGTSNKSSHKFCKECGTFLE